MSTNTNQYENTILINRKNKALRASQRRITKTEAERYLQNSLFINIEERHFENIWKLQLNRQYFTLARMTRDILTIAKNEAEVERLFNQERDITYYRRAIFVSKRRRCLWWYACIRIKMKIISHYWKRILRKINCILINKIKQFISKLIWFKILKTRYKSMMKRIW